MCKFQGCEKKVLSEYSYESCDTKFYEKDYTIEIYLFVIKICTSLKSYLLSPIINIINILIINYTLLNILLFLFI